MSSASDWQVRKEHQLPVRVWKESFMAFILTLNTRRIRITRKTNQDEKGYAKPKWSQIASWAGEKLGFWVECTEKQCQRRLSQVAVALNANTGSFTDEKPGAGRASSFCSFVSSTSEIAPANVLSANKENQYHDLQKLKHFQAIFSPNTIQSKGKKKMLFILDPQ